MSNRMWMIRAGEGAFLVEDFLSKNLVSIGWNDLKDIKQYSSLENLKAAMRKIFTEYTDGQINMNAGQLFRFANEIKLDDYVVTYEPATRNYHVGIIKSDSFYKPGFTKHHDNLREVSWEKVVSRDKLSASAKNSLGAIMTIFEISGEPKKELLAPSDKVIESIPESKEELTLDTIREETVDKAREFTKDKIFKLNWEEMQELVAGLLRAMGYKTRVSKKGSDLGVDIVASPDGLGLEEPRIRVEVKHRSGTIGAPEIRSFTAAFHEKDKGLYVSTGGFSKEAQYESRTKYPLTLVDIDILVELILQHYDQFDSEARTILPLRKIYWPA